MEGRKMISSSGQTVQDTGGFEQRCEEQCPAASISPTLQNVVEGERECLYEALSYVWGGSTKPKSVLIDGCQLAVTENLYIALLHLRDQYIERILWIDAICINQGDKKEQGHQVRSMARIYCKASRVIVWLGEKRDESDQALKAIRLAAETGPEGFANKEESGKEILALLKRDWFQRIWVLQEVAAARHILIMCCSTTIDGYAFCLGLESSKIPYNAFQEQHLRNVIRSISYLIKGSIFRPKYTTTPSGAISLGIRPLGELIDMYHTREATEPLDKVFALLGMSSDDYGVALSPDYTVSIEKIMYQLVKFILGKRVFVNTWHNNEIIAIKARGCVLGIVSSIEGSGLDDRQQISIRSKDASGKMATLPESKWVLQPSANSVHVDDIVCFLEGASKPTIIRFCRDHFFVLMIAVRPPHIADETIKKWEKDSVASFSLEFLLVWDWAKLQEILHSREYVKFIENRTQENSAGDFKSLPNRISRLWNAALILEEAENHETSQERLREALNYCECDLGAENLRTIESKERLALVLYSAEEEMWEIMSDILKPDGKNAQEKIAQITRRCSSSQIQFLLAWNAVQVTEGLLIAAAATEDGRDTALNGLLEWIKEENIDPKLLITENVLKTAARSSKHAVSKICMLLESFNQDGKDSRNQITEGVLKAAIGNEEHGLQIVKTLLESLGQDAKNDRITEDVLRVAVGNNHGAEDILKLLLETLNQKTKKYRITEDVLHDAAENYYTGKDIVKLLLAPLDRKMKQDIITTKVLKAATCNFCGEIILKLLLESLDRKQKQDRITKDLLRAAVNKKEGNLKLLLEPLDREDKQDRITEVILEAAAARSEYEKLATLLESLDHKEMMTKTTKSVLVKAVRNQYCAVKMTRLLFNSLGNERTNIQISEDILLAAIENRKYREYHKDWNELIKILFEWGRNETQVTEKVLVEAILQCDLDAGAIKLLLNKEWRKVPITEAVLLAGMGEKLPRNGLKVLVNEAEWSQITEAVLITTMDSSLGYKENLDICLERIDYKFTATESILAAAAACGNPSQVFYQLLKNTKDRISLKEPVLIAAAGNIYFKTWDLQAILSGTDDRLEIAEGALTEAVLVVALRGDDRNIETFKILFNYADSRIIITENLTAALEAIPEPPSYSLGKEVARKMTVAHKEKYRNELTENSVKEAGNSSENDLSS